MTGLVIKDTTHPSGIRGLIAIAGVAFVLTASPVLAGESGAEAAIGRAAAKIEMATRQAGVAGDQGDQSYNMSRGRLDAARTAFKSRHFDDAEMLADEASLLAELTSEKAKLAALQTSHDLVANSVAPPARPQ